MALIRRHVRVNEEIAVLMKSLAIKGILGAAAVAGAVGIAQLGGSTSSGPGFAAPAQTQATAQTATIGQVNAELSGKVATRARGILRRVEHGQFTVATKHGDTTYDIQAGKVTSVDATALVVTSRDGFVGTYTVTASTKVRVGRQPSDISSVHVGDLVRVLASGGDALRVRAGASAEVNGSGPAAQTTPTAAGASTSSPNESERAATRVG